VEFRHPACRPGASLAARSASLAGSECRLLPDFREGLIEGLLPADEATLQRLRPLWASYGMPLPAEAPEHLVEVRLSDDPDATAFPYPPCCVLSRYGLMSSADKLAAPAVQGVLAKLRGGWGCGGCGGHSCGCRWVGACSSCMLARLWCARLAWLW
jgi:hypothetical protein